MSLTGWTALSAIGTLVLAVVTAAALAVTVWLAQTERKRDAELRRQDREREDQLRREVDEKWERRRRDEQDQREDDDAQQQVTVEFLTDGTRAQRAVTTGDGITHRIIVRAPTAYPIKWVGAEIGYRTNSGLGTISPGWTFERPVTNNGEVRYTCFANVNPQVRDPAPIVRFADRNGNLYYSYLGYTRRFGQNTDWITAATEIDEWIRTGPRPDDGP